MTDLDIGRWREHAALGLTCAEGVYLVDQLAGLYAERDAGREIDGIPALAITALERENAALHATRDALQGTCKQLLAERDQAREAREARDMALGIVVKVRQVLEGMLIQLGPLPAPPGFDAAVQQALDNVREDRT